MANEKGVWRTIGGRRVFIKEGQDLASAMKESGKFKSASKGTAKKEMTKEEKVFEDFKNSDGSKENFEKALNKISEMEYNNEINPDEYKDYISKIQKEYVEKNRKAGEENKSEKLTAFGEKKEFTREELKARYGTDDVDLINAGREKENRVSLKESNDNDYALYKKAKLDPDSIGPMAENSTDWEALDKQYKNRFEKEGLKAFKEKFEEYQKSLYDEDGTFHDNDTKETLKLGEELRKLEKDYELKGKDIAPIQQDIVKKYDKLNADKLDNGKPYKSMEQAKKEAFGDNSTKEKTRNTSGRQEIKNASPSQIEKGDLIGPKHLLVSAIRPASVEKDGYSSGYSVTTKDSNGNTSRQIISDSARNTIYKKQTTNQSMSDTLRNAFDDYKKKHKNSNMSFTEFMRINKK